MVTTNLRRGAASFVTTLLERLAGDVAVDESTTPGTRQSLLDWTERYRTISSTRRLSSGRYPSCAWQARHCVLRKKMRLPQRHS